MAVTQRGTDPNGRPIRATPTMWDAWDHACAELGFTPTIVQGGWMGASGAAASAGTHAGDAFDLRLWDRTQQERDAMIRVFRAYGFAYWERYETQGFDLHAHMIPGPWASPAPEARTQWDDYLRGLDGLARKGSDYHPRPNPIPTQPPEDPMADYAAQLDRIERKIDASRTRQIQIRKRVIGIDRQLDQLEAAVADDATKKQIRNVRADIAALATDDEQTDA